MRRFSLVVPLIAALVVGVATARRWREPTPPPVAETEPRHPPAVGLRQAGIVLRHKGVKQAEVTASLVTVSRDLRYTTFKRIERITLYDQGRLALSLRTGEIVLDRSTNDLVAHGEVEVASPQGDLLWAPQARWVNATQRLIFPRGVRLKVSGADVTASRLTVDTRLQIFELEGGVDISFQLPARTTP